MHIFDITVYLSVVLDMYIDFKAILLRSGLEI